MAEITAALVKDLRERTGAGMMECKKALVEANGDLAQAEIVLRKRGVASASKKSSRATKQGAVGTYIHPGSQLGVMVEINCESDFVARTEDFQELVRDIAMQIAAADPKYLRKEDVTTDILDRERDIQRGPRSHSGHDGCGLYRHSHARGREPETRAARGVEGCGARNDAPAQGKPCARHRHQSRPADDGRTRRHFPADSRRCDRHRRG